MKKIEYEFYKWRKPILTLDIIISILVIILLGFMRPDYLVIAVFFLAIPYLIFSKRKTALYHFLVAFLISIVWTIIARNQYEYNHEFLSILGINTFPLFAWALGLFLIYMIYSYLEHLLKEKGFIKKIILLCIIYFPLLLIIETLAYYLFNIHNLATSQFQGLPICNCIHAPFWMQISYLVLGPIFFTICYLLKLENPHLVKKNKSK